MKENEYLHGQRSARKYSSQLPRSIITVSETLRTCEMKPHAADASWGVGAFWTDRRNRINQKHDAREDGQTHLAGNGPTAFSAADAFRF